MDSRPTVSVLMAVYNGERYLAGAIDSMLAQTLRDFEFVIVNDGSSDGTAMILEAARQRDGRIVVLTNEQNLGLIASLNRGLRQSRGRYVARMDADDVSLPKRLQRQSEYLDAHPEVFLVGTRTIIIDEHGAAVSLSRNPVDPDAIARRLEKTNCLYHSSIVFRNEPWLRYRSKMVHVEDYDLYLRLLSAGKRIANLPEPLLRYRLSASSISLVHRAKQALLAAQARTFFAERKRRGGDSYDAFDPRAILSLDPATSNDPLVLREQIGGTFRAGAFSETRALCWRYVRRHGVFNRIPVYFLATFLGQRALKLKRRLYAKT